MEPETTTQEIQPAAAAPAVGCRHLHRCQNCGLIWGHGNMLDGDIAAHVCAKCGALEWRVYTGLQPRPAAKPKGFRINWVALSLAIGLALVVFFVLRARRHMELYA